VSDRAIFSGSRRRATPIGPRIGLLDVVVDLHLAVAYVVWAGSAS
jgi:hypothetical protein